LKASLRFFVKNDLQNLKIVLSERRFRRYFYAKNDPMEKIFTRFGMKLLFFLAGLAAATAQNEQVGLVYRDDLAGLEGVEVHCAACPEANVWTNADGLFSFEGLFPNTYYAFVPKKDGDDSEGLTVLDLCVLRRHILGLDFIEDPNRLRAADVNLTNTVTTLDLVLIVMVILEETSGFSDTDSWTFEPPLIQLNDLTGEPLGFLGIKMGDVIREEEVSLADVHPEFSFPLIPADAPGPVTAAVKVKNFAQIEALQFSLAWDPNVLHLNSVTSPSLPGFLPANFHQPAPGRLNVWWLDMSVQPLWLPDEAELLTLDFTVLTPSPPVQLGLDPDGIPFQVVADGCQLVETAPVLTVVEAPPPVRIELTDNPSLPGQLVRFRVQSDRALELRGALMDISGRVLAEWEQNIPEGTTELVQQAPQAPGVYFLRMWAPGAGVQVIKWVVGG
jgi:hypothetical protein